MFSSFPEKLPPPQPVSAPQAARSCRVAIAGLGTIGKVLAEKLAAGEVPGVTLTAVAVRDANKARHWLDSRGCSVDIVPLAELPSTADMIVECMPAELVGDVAALTLRAGKKIMILSAGALLSRPDLIDIAKAHGGQIIVPSGALLGLDAVTAAAEGHIRSVRMVTRKPVSGLLGAPYLAEHGIDITGLDAPLKVFEGTAREAARGFPANLNVAAALSLAGIGPDQTRQEIWADPGLDRNTHHIYVDADSARLEMTIENVPSDNPKTGRITAMSVIAALRKINSPLRVAT